MMVKRLAVGVAITILTLGAGLTLNQVLAQPKPEPPPAATTTVSVPGAKDWAGEGALAVVAFFWGRIICTTSPWESRGRLYIHI